MMKLSILTPYYNCYNYINALRSVLEPQLNDNVEWIIVDDGCYEERLDNFKAKVIHLENNSGCAGIPRNVAINNASGEYITFIDADDFVFDNYIEKIFEKIENEEFDYCLMSWKSDHFMVDVVNGRPEWNCSVWGIVYKRDLIGDIRFNNIRVGEDYTFNKNVLKGKCAIIPDCLYYYRSNSNGIMANVK